METTILELSQKPATVIYNNGDYMTTLTKELEILEGDEITIKNVFVDTTNSSGSEIYIDKDITLEFYHGFYLNNWFNSSDKQYYNADGKTENMVDGEDYIAMKYKKTPAPEELLGETAFAILKSIEYEATTRADPNWGLVNLVYSYISVDGEKHKFTVKIPEENKTRTTYYTYNSGLILVKNSLKLENPKQLTIGAVKEFKYNFENITEDNFVFYPYILTTTIPLVKGSYEPSQLADYISEKLSINKSGTDSIINSPYLKTTRQGGVNRDSDLDGDIVFVKTSTGNKIFNFKSDAVSSYYVGTSQIQFSYDNEFNKFELNFLNMPFYSSSNIAVKYKNIIDNDGNPTNTLFPVLKNSGIFFTALDAFDSEGNYYDFWEAKLGFDLSEICVKIPHDLDTRDFTGLGLTNCHIPLIKLENGINVTASYAGLDTVVNKSFTGEAGFAIVPPATTTPSTTGQQLSMTGKELQSSLTLGSSHFLLEITTNIKNNYYNFNRTDNKIFGIINRYYGYSSFTAGGAEVSVPYIHRGLPAFLSSIKVRILNPDFSLPSELGPENVVYLQITRQLKQQIPPQIENKKDNEEKKDNNKK